MTSRSRSSSRRRSDRPSGSKEGGDDDDAATQDSFAGLRIRVRFAKPNEWFWGTISGSKPAPRGWNLQVVYDDGTSEEIRYSKNTTNIIVKKPLSPGDLLLIEYSGEGEYLCRLSIRDKFWVVESADGTFTEQVPFDPAEDTWRPLKFSMREKKEMIQKVQLLSTEEIQSVLDLIKDTSPHVHLEPTKKKIRISLEDLEDITLWNLQKFLAARSILPKKISTKRNVRQKRERKAKRAVTMRRDKSSSSEYENVPVGEKRKKRGTRAGEKSRKIFTNDMAGHEEKAKVIEHMKNEVPPDNVYVVEAICGKRDINGVAEYNVKWDGFEAEYNTWEPVENLQGVLDMVREYEAISSAKDGDASRAKRRQITKLWNSIRNIISQLRKNSAAKPFSEPIDPSAPYAKKYFQLIKQPMDLAKIGERLGKFGLPPKYELPKEVFRDVQLMWSNARTFNPKEHWVCQQAEVLEQSFENMWLSSNIDQRWSQLHHKPSSPLVRQTNRKRRGFTDGPELAKEEDRNLIMDVLQGTWVCKPITFGHLVIEGNNGVYAGGNGKLYDFKVLKNKSVSATWNRVDAEGTRGTLTFRF